MLRHQERTAAAKVAAASAPVAASASGLAPARICGVARAASGIDAAAAAVPLYSTACKRLLKSQLSHQAYAEGIT